MVLSNSKQPSDDVPDRVQRVAANGPESRGDSAVNDQHQAAEAPGQETGDDQGSGASDEQEELSLEDLGAAFAKAAAIIDSEQEASAFDAPEQSEEPEQGLEPESPPDEDDVDVVTPAAIIEGALFVGHPENQPFTAPRLASLMRDVQPDEVVAIIDDLNESYRNQHQAFRIVQDERGYRLSTMPKLDSLRRSFLGKVRETRLSQLAVEVLSLVAYQPGISAATIRDQRGRDCGPVLNQLVRRRLLEVRREKDDASSRPTAHYYPSERFLDLFGLDSLDDLPQVDPADGSAD